jgi:DNA-binding PadR family transcriptional regulator
MAIKNKTRYAILGILSIGPGSGYDIKKYCDTIISNFWNENFGHIYPVLSSLLKEGYISNKDDSPALRRKEYYITEKGKEEFMKWLTEPAEYQPVRSEFMLKLVFSNHLPKETTIKLLNEYKVRHENNLKKYMEMELSLSQKDSVITKERQLYLYAPMRYGIISAKAAIEWCNEILNLLETL